jgi:hypothetical protein
MGEIRDIVGVDEHKIRWWLAIRWSYQIFSYVAEHSKKLGYMDEKMNKRFKEIEHLIKSYNDRNKKKREYRKNYYGKFGGLKKNER